MNEAEIIKIINENPLVLTYFSQPSCTVCKTLRPKVEALVHKYQEITFLYIDTQSHPGLGGQNMIFAVPTMVLFRQGKEVKRFSRYIAIKELQMEIERYHNYSTNVP